MSTLIALILAQGPDAGTNSPDICTGNPVSTCSPDAGTGSPDVCRGSLSASLMQAQAYVQGRAGLRSAVPSKSLALPPFLRLAANCSCAATLLSVCVHMQGVPQEQ